MTGALNAWHAQPSVCAMGTEVGGGQREAFTYMKGALNAWPAQRLTAH